MIAKIAVDAATFAIDKPYSYLIPDKMYVFPGMRVQVPFGKGNRIVEGIVVGVTDGAEENLKTIDKCLDDNALLTDRMLQLAAFMRERYFCTFYDSVKAMLPSGLWFRLKETYSLTADRDWEGKNLRVPGAFEILKLLIDCGGTTDGKIIREILPDEDVRERALRYLLRKKWLFTEVDHLRRLGDKVERIVSLAVPAHEAMHYAEGLGKAATMQKAVLSLLCSVGEVSVKELCYFTGAKTSTVNRLISLGFLNSHQREVLRCKEIVPSQNPEPIMLNHEQQTAFDGLNDNLRSSAPKPSVLHGVTGSGKTAIYIRLIHECIDSGRQAILLVPEIALTPQLLGLMASYFKDRVAVLHSSLPATERYDQWKRIRDGETSVVVGTRSAVFAPCANLGLLILDEEQEHSYKSENTPRYDAREIALWRGMKEKALILFGSATPSVQTMYHAKNGDYCYYQLKNRYNGKTLPKVDIVDMKRELEEGNVFSLSHTLQDAIGENRNAGKQTVLFLNRRGNSRALVCIDCREAPECPRCNVKLTYHSANERLMCHYCGHSQKMTGRCPKCGGELKRMGTGTQKIQQELECIYPGISVLRMDTDTVSATNTHEMILNKFKNEKVNVLLGTQMVAKGLNFPDVTLVGVVDADMGLFADSYLAAETTFNMITQVVGRAGRGDFPGKAMLQTAMPDHSVIKLAAVQDYDGFYEMEIALRKLQNYPPFGDLVSVTFTGKDEIKVLRSASKFRDSVRSCLLMDAYRNENCDLLGPAPCPVPKINYNYRYRLTIRCTLNRNLRQLFAHLLRQFSQDRECRGVSAFIDVNGME